MKFEFSPTTPHEKKGEHLKDRRSVGASSCNSGDGTDQRVQSLMFMMIMMMMMMMNFLQRVTKNTQIYYFMKIRQVGAELFHVKLDGGAYLKVDGPHGADRCRRKIPCIAQPCCLLVAATDFK